jgi:hypothetical protein
MFTRKTVALFQEDCAKMLGSVESFLTQMGDFCLGHSFLRGLR